ncbi:MAG: hypothetical protein LBK59_06330 [Bifidobacteriaceae bacterium]|nr:hypothetical protein [Bifidobacteriaceae bacterium]
MSQAGARAWQRHLIGPILVDALAAHPER